MNLPTLTLQHFHASNCPDEFYVNSIACHLDLNSNLVGIPHSHDFYLCVCFLKGHGVHQIDFQSYDVGPGSIFFLKPGQTHSWKFRSRPEGYIFFHSQAFYDLNFLGHSLSNFPFFCSNQNSPVVIASNRELMFVRSLLDAALLEYRDHMPLREIKIVNLINTIYIELSRIYTRHVSPKESCSDKNSLRLNQLENLIEKNFILERFPKFYADQLHTTTKNLNRAIKASINKTTSELISERVVLEAKRKIVHATGSLAEVAYTLNFSDYSYFSKFFKAKTGMTPNQFRKKHAKSLQYFS